MKASVRVSNVDKVLAELRHTGDRVVGSARGAMRRAAARIVENARINAPRDRWNLEESIQLVRDYGIRGRLELTIEMGGVVNGVNVDQYALIIHENYEGIIVDDDNPERRQGTREKQAQYPNHYIGGKFLSRAVDEEQQKLMKHLVGAVTHAIKGGGT